MVLTCSKEHVLFDIVKITAGHDGCHRLPADALCRPDIDRATRFSAWREVDTGATKTHHDQTTADTHNYHLAHNTLMLRAKNQPKNTRPRSIKQLPARHN